MIKSPLNSFQVFYRTEAHCISGDKVCTIVLHKLLVICIAEMLLDFFGGTQRW